MAGFPDEPEVTSCFTVLTEECRWMYEPARNDSLVVGKLYCGAGCKISVHASPRGNDPTHAIYLWSQARSCPHGMAPRCAHYV